jgi:hypothetical protein
MIVVAAMESDHTVSMNVLWETVNGPGKGALPTLDAGKPKTNLVLVGQVGLSWYSSLKREKGRRRERWVKLVAEPQQKPLWCALGGGVL